ncbi:MAG: beta-lactamase family protein [Pyrinomonadaceae bacterium]|nr:beta-lactamase family protein [Pyrinomonadaceae bacterium]
MKTKNLVTIFIAIFLFAVSINADQVDEIVRAQLAERHIPGAAVAVIKNGKVIKMKGYGLASVEFNVPATPETVFEIGSVSKQITAAAVMLLVEDGKINLDEKISTYLPNTPEAWKDVTVRHLLTHTSGVKSYTSLGGFELSKRYKVGDFIKELSPQPLEFEPGSTYKYSNSGYSLLGYIIESASGKSYWEFLRERIFGPLKMTNTADRDPQFIIKNRATGYEWENGKLVGRDYNLTDLFSAGAIVSTVADLAKWDIALRDETLLKTSSKNESWKPFILTNGKENSYGFGWNVGEFRGQRLVSHGGQTAGFAANLSRYRDADLDVIVLTNLGTQGAGSAIARAIAKNYIPSISLKALKTQTQTDENISKLVKTALGDVLQNKLNPELLAENLIKTLSTERAKAENSRISSFGKIKKLDFVGDETSNGKRIYRYKAETSKRLFLWRISVNDEGKISEMVLEEEEPV